MKNLFTLCVQINRQKIDLSNSVQTTEEALMFVALTDKQYNTLEITIYNPNLEVTRAKYVTTSFLIQWKLKLAQKERRTPMK